MGAAVSMTLSRYSVSASVWRLLRGFRWLAGAFLLLAALASMAQPAQGAAVGQGYLEAARVDAQARTLDVAKPRP
jgi:hypothetical protein